MQLLAGAAQRLPDRRRHGRRWVEVLNTASESYGGTNVGNMGAVEAEAIEWDGQPASGRVTLPPLATVWLAPE